MRLSAFAICALATLGMVMACIGGPIGPDSMAASASPVRTSLLNVSRPADSTHDLFDGSFTLTFGNGDSIEGTYTGRASLFNPGRDTATLEFTVTDGSGAFEGAEGTLTGEGAGAYSGEGEFKLSVKGTLSTAREPDGVTIHTNIQGSTSLSCESLGIVATLTGNGNVPRFGRTAAELTHTVGGTSCENERGLMQSSNGCSVRLFKGVVVSAFRPSGGPS